MKCKALSQPILVPVKCRNRHSILALRFGIEVAFCKASDLRYTSPFQRLWPRLEIIHNRTRLLHIADFSLSLSFVLPMDLVLKFEHINGFE